MVFSGQVRTSLSIIHDFECRIFVGGTQGGIPVKVRLTCRDKGGGGSFRRPGGRGPTTQRRTGSLLRGRNIAGRTYPSRWVYAGRDLAEQGSDDLSAGTVVPEYGDGPAGDLREIAALGPCQADAPPCPRLRADFHI